MGIRGIPYLFSFPPISLTNNSNHLPVINKEVFDTPTGGQINSGISTFTSISANLTAKGDLLASIATVTSTTANLTEALIGGAIAASISTVTTTSANLTAKGILLTSIITVTSISGNIWNKASGAIQASIYTGSLCALINSTFIPSFELIYLKSNVVNFNLQNSLIKNQLLNDSKLTNQLNGTSDQLNALIIISGISSGLIMNSRIPGTTVYSAINTKTSMNGTLN